MTEPAGLLHRYATVNGIRMHYVEQGEGPLVVLLHGFPEFWYSWRHQIPALATRFRVVAPDQRGYNLTEKPRGVEAYKTSTLADDVAALVRHLGAERAHVVGHDWGGGVAWTFAMQHPELLATLAVLNCPHPALMARGILRPRQLLRSWYIFFFQLPWLPEKLLSARGYRAALQPFREWPHRPGTFSRDDLRAYREAMAQPGALTAMINWYRALSRTRPPIQTPIIDAPTLVIWAEDDKALGVELTHGLERYVRDLTIRYVPETSHWVQQERPELVNQYLLEFLR
jgi:pimeloyl-ACP methyl ester carboxylesterase